MKLLKLSADYEMSRDREITGSRAIRLRLDRDAERVENALVEKLAPLRKLMQTLKTH